MTGRFPEIPSTTKKQQEELREKFMIQTRKHEMFQQAGLEEEPPRKSTKGGTRNDREDHRCHG